MPIYECDKCKYETKFKSRMITHLNNKNPCVNQRIIVNKQIMDNISKASINNNIALLNQKNINMIKEPIENLEKNKKNNSLNNDIFEKK